MQSELYVPKDSAVHRLDPRTKIVGLALAFLASVILDNPSLLGLSLAATLWLGLLAGAGPNLWRAKWLLVLLTAMCLAFWSPGRSLAHGLTVALRLDLMLAAGTLFVSAIRIEEFSQGLVLLGLPYRPAFAVSLAFRFIPLFLATVRTTVEAQQSRGLDLSGGGIVSRLRGYIPLFVPVISLSVRNANCQAMALESKGFGLAGIRTHYTGYRMRWTDHCLIALLAALLGMACCLRYHLCGL